MAKQPQKKANHGRAPGKTQISISLPQALVDKIDVLAEKENRNRSNFISTHLEQLAEKAGITADSKPAKGRRKN